jgi:hypothetical protein
MIVYKLVRFYLPNSKGEYINTRVTLTVFSQYNRCPNRPFTDLHTCSDFRFLTLIDYLLGRSQVLPRLRQGFTRLQNTWSVL